MRELFRAHSLLGFLFFPMLVMAQITYNSPQLEQFEQTNQCPGCNLSNICWGNTTCSTRDHDNAVLSQANLSNGSIAGGDSLNLTGSNLEGANFSNFQSGIESINFSGADMKNAVFTMAYLPNSNFTKSNLAGAAFNGAYLERANFYGAIGANLTGADVCDAILPDGSKGKCSG